MFPGFSEDTVRFFMDIRFHNNREFMHAHKDEYKALVQEPFYALIDELAPVMRRIDPEMEVRPQKVLSRIYRDTRFSSDKSPYRDHHWIAFRPEGTDRYGQPFYWFEFGPDRLSWGAGIWGESREAMNALRGRILSGPDDVQRVLDACAKNSIAVSGESFRRYKVPPQVPEPLRGLYSMKYLYFERLWPRYEWAFTPEIVSRVSRDFRAMKPVWKLLREIVSQGTDQAPDPQKAPSADREDLWTTEN